MNQIRKIPVTAVVFTLNEAENIQDCVASLTDFEEVIVIDSGSTDNTLEQCEEMRLRVVDFRWNGIYPKKRQWTLENVSFNTSWIFFVDADERCTKSLVCEISDLLERDTVSFAAGQVKLSYFFCNKKLRFGGGMSKTVLLDPSRATFAPVDDLLAKGMGELEGHYQPQINGKIYRLKSRLVHNDNDGIDSWMERHIRYANWEAYLLNRPNIHKSVMKSKSHQQTMKLKIVKFQGLSYFLYSYFIKFGFLDGRAGFNFAFGRAWYYWLSSVIAREERDSLT